jgi:hypothetical protein
LLKDVVVVEKWGGKQTRNIKQRFCSSLNTESICPILSIFITTMIGLEMPIDCFGDYGAAVENDASCEISIFKF